MGHLEIIILLNGKEKIFNKIPHLCALERGEIKEKGGGFLGNFSFEGNFFSQGACSEKKKNRGCFQTFVWEMLLVQGGT